MRKNSNVFFILLIIGLKAQTDISSSKALVQRILRNHFSSIELAIIKGEKDKDVFEIETKNNKLILSGNNGVAIASALYFYLNEFCHAQITWNGINLQLPKILPAVPSKIHKETPYDYRYYLNYCTFNYSMSWWDWNRWEKEID